MGHDEVSGGAVGPDIIAVAAAAVELADVDTFCVAMATDEYGQKFGLSFQVPISGEYDEQDERLEMNTYSISDHVGRTEYGGVLAWSADAGQSVLAIEFSQALAESLDMPANVRFHLPPDKFDQMIAGFRRIIAGEKRGINLPVERVIP